MTVASSPWVRHEGFSRSRSSYSSRSADLIGVEWAPATDSDGLLANYNPADPEGTIYEPLSDLGVCLPTTFDVSKDEFQAAAAFDIAQLGISEEGDADYALVASIEADGYAVDKEGDGYAEKFLTDEVEIYFGLYSESNGQAGYQADEIIGAVQVEVELRRKVDILFDGGTSLSDVASFLGALNDDNIKSFIEEIEISYASSNPGDPLISEIAGLATQIGEVISKNAPNLASLIEVEAGNPYASSWAKSVFPALLAHCEVGYPPAAPPVT